MVAGSLKDDCVAKEHSYMSGIQGSCSPLRTHVCMTSQLFNKDVFLLPSPSLRKVPRGSQKTELQRLRCYVDALCSSIEMSEDQVKQKLTQVFEKLLVNSEGRPVR